MQFRFKGSEGRSQHSGVVNGEEVVDRDLVKGDIIDSEVDLSKSLPDRFEKTENDPPVKLSRSEQAKIDKAKADKEAADRAKADDEKVQQ